METLKDYLRSDWDKVYDQMEKMNPEEEHDRGLFESVVNFFMGGEVYKHSIK